MENICLIHKTYDQQKIDFNGGFFNVLPLFFLLEILTTLLNI